MGYRIDNPKNTYSYEMLWAGFTTAMAEQILITLSSRVSNWLSTWHSSSSELSSSSSQPPPKKSCQHHMTSTLQQKNWTKWFRDVSRIHASHHASQQHGCWPGSNKRWGCPKSLGPRKWENWEHLKLRKQTLYKSPGKANQNLTNYSRIETHKYQSRWRFSQPWWHSTVLTVAGLLPHVLPYAAIKNYQLGMHHLWVFFLEW